MIDAVPLLLLVEDSPDDAELLSMAREAKGSRFALDIVRDGVGALEYLHSERTAPELVLLDLHLPRLDGFEVLERLRADKRTRTLPVVVFSSSQATKDVERARQLGANGYLRKPHGFESLCVLLRELEGTWLRDPFR
jgi:CheY-like chemotaxis protein